MKSRNIVAFITLVQISFFASGISMAWASEPGPTLLCACDIIDWAVVQLGPEGLAASLKLPNKPLVCITGSALGGAATSPDRRSSCALALLETGGVDVVNLSADDFSGDPAALVAAVTQAKIPVLSASFRFKNGKPAPWKEFTVIEQQGKKIVCIGLASRRPSQNLPGRTLSADLEYIEPQKALADVLPKAEKEGDTIVILADVRPAEAQSWKARSPRISAVVVSGKGIGTKESETPAEVLFAPPGGKTFLLNSPLRLISLPTPKTVSPRFREITAKFACAPVPPEQPSVEQPAAMTASAVIGTSPVPIDKGKLSQGNVDQKTILPPKSTTAVPLIETPSVLSLTPEKRQEELTFFHPGNRLLAMRLSTADANTRIDIRGQRKESFGTLKIDVNYMHTFDSIRAASQVIDDLPQLPGTWTLTIALIGKEARQISASLVDLGPIPVIKYGDTMGRLIIRHLGSIPVEVSPEKDVRVYHPAFKSANLKPDLSPQGDAIFQLPSGIWRILCRPAKTGLENGQAAFIPVSAGATTEIDWPSQREEEGVSDFQGITGLRLRWATATGDIGLTRVAAPALEEVPEKPEVQVFEGGKQGQVLDIQPATGSLHVVLLFDSSGSMKKTIKSALDGAVAFAKGLSDNCTLEIVDFDTQPRDLKGKTRAEMIKSLQALKADGATALNDTVLVGLKKAAGHERTALVLFTDGFDANHNDTGPGSKATPEQLFKAVQEARVPIFTIGFGEKPDDVTLTRLAQLSDGAFFRANPDTIAAVFEKIRNLISREFIVKYQRPPDIADGNTPVVCVVLDVSGSMDSAPGKSPGAGYKLESARELLRTFFQQVATGTVVNFLTFNDQIQNLQVPTSDPLLLVRSLASLRSGGGTNVFGAVDAAFRGLQGIPSRRRYLLFVTDAALKVPEGKQKMFDALLGSYKDAGIRSLWVGMVGSEEKAPFAATAKAAGGEFIVSPGMDSLADSLKKLRETLGSSSDMDPGIPLQLLVTKRTPTGDCQVFEGNGRFILPGAATKKAVPVGCLRIAMTSDSAAPASGPATPGNRPNDAAPVGKAPAGLFVEGNTIPMQIVGQNQALKLTVQDAIIYSVFQGLESGGSRRFVELRLRFENLLPEQEIRVPEKGNPYPAAWSPLGKPGKAVPPCLIADLRQRLFLRWNDGTESPVSDASVFCRDPLLTTESAGLLVPSGAPLEGRVVFLVKGTNLQKASLHLYDNAWGHLDMPLVGKMESRSPVLADIPTRAADKISDNFSVKLLGMRDTASAAADVTPEKGMLYRQVDLTMESTIQASIRLDPAACTRLVLPTDKGPVYIPPSPLSMFVPGGLFRPPTLAPGPNNRFQQIFCLPAALASTASGSYFVGLRERHLELPFDQKTAGLSTEKNEKNNSKATIQVNQICLVGRSEGLPSDLLAIDLTLSDCTDGLPTWIGNSFLLTAAGADALGQGPSASSDRRPPAKEWKPSSVTRNLHFGLNSSTMLFDGTRMRGILLFPLPGDGAWNVQAPEFGFSTPLGSPSRGISTPWLLTRKPELPLLQPNSLEAKILKAAQEFTTGQPTKGAQPGILFADEYGNLERPECPIIPLTWTGEALWQTLRSKTEGELLSTLGGFHLVNQAAGPWETCMAPEALLIQESGSSNDLANLAREWYEGKGIPVETIAVKLSAAGLLEAGKVLKEPRVANPLPALKTPAGVLVFPFLKQAAEIGPWIEQVIDKPIKKQSGNTTLTLTVFVEPRNASAGGASGQAPGSRKGVELIKTTLPASVFSCDAAQIFFTEAIGDDGPEIRAVLETAAGRFPGTVGIPTGLWKPVIEEISVRGPFLSRLQPWRCDLESGGVPTNSQDAHVATGAGSLLDTCHALAIGIPGLPASAATGLAAAWRDKHSTEVPNSFSIARWLARSRLAGLLAAQTRWEQSAARDLGVTLSRSEAPLVIIYTSKRQDCSLVQTIDSCQINPQIIGESKACSTFRLMHGFMCASLGEAFPGGESVTAIWKSSGDFVAVPPKKRPAFLKDLESRKFPSAVFDRLKQFKGVGLFSRYPVKRAGQPLWGWLVIEPETFVVDSIFSTGDRRMIHILENTPGLPGLFAGAETEIWSGSVFAPREESDQSVLQKAEALAKNVAACLNNAGEPASASPGEGMAQFALAGVSYPDTEDSRYRKFISEFNANIASWSNRPGRK